jgi:group I intron endonuclease
LISIFRYLRPSYIKSSVTGTSAIRNAIIKYGLNNFSLIILEQCDLAVLTRQEQYWIDLLAPSYNILTAAKSSAGYIHTPESLVKMKGPRPYYKPTSEQNAALAERNRTRVYTEEYRNMVSIREGHTIFVYSENFKYLGWYPSINKRKLALNVTLHTVTIQRYIRKGVNSPNVINMIWSHTPLPYNAMSLLCLRLGD